MSGAKRKSPPKDFSAYLVIASDTEEMPVGQTLIDKGQLLIREWNLIDFKTGEHTGAVGVRMARLCADCRVKHKIIGILGHDGDHGIAAVKDEALGTIKDAIHRYEAEEAAS